MKNDNENNMINGNKYSTMKNLKTTLNIKKNKTLNYKILKNSYINANNHRKSISKFNSNFAKSIYHINSLLDKMNSLKQLMYHTTDLRSILVMDKCGLKYSNNLRKKINSAKKLMSPNSPNSKNIENSEIFLKSNNKEININYYKGIKIPNYFRNNNRKFKKKLINLSKEFDLTSISNINKKKRDKLQKFLENEKKDKKLYHLKTELFLLEERNKLNDLNISENKLKNNLTFIREDKDNYYSQIKSKYMKRTPASKNKIKKNLITMHKPYNISQMNSISRTTFNNNNMIKIKINDNNTDFNYINTSETEQTIKPNKKIIYLKDKINSYKTKKEISKQNKNLSNDIFITHNILETPLQTSPNLSMFKNSINPRCKTAKKINKMKKIKKINNTLTHLTNSNNSQENTSLNSLNSSHFTNEIIHSKYKNSINLINQNMGADTVKNIKKRKKFNIINHINNIMEKSNIIRKNFIIDIEVGKKEKNKFFLKHNYNYKLNHVNINKINNDFKFSKKEDINETELIKENAKKVKAIMDKKCSKILDGVINKIYYQDQKLNKKYFGLSSYEKKLMKIKRENDIKKISNDHVLMEKIIERDKILDIFVPENDEIIKIIKEDKKNLNDSIEKIYAKSMVLKRLQN